DAQTAYLRTLRDATRTQMEAFLEGLLDHVAEEYGRAHPIAAQAANATTSRRPKRTNRLAAKSNGGSGRAAGGSSRLAGLPAGRRTSPALAEPTSPIPLPRAASRDETEQFDARADDHLNGFPQR
ncbi:MAG TPA: hypothetical protein VIJ00_15710, partial [Nakamurella sp.]